MARDRFRLLRHEPTRSPRLRFPARCLLLGTMAVSFSPPSGLAAQEDAVLAGRVSVQRTGQPLPSARISVLGSGRSARTDSRGRFLIERLPPGMHVIEVTFLGAVSRRESIRLVAGEVHQVEVVLQIDVYPLPALSIAVEPRPRGKLYEFYRRRAREHGIFFTHREIERLRPSETSDLLLQVPGLRLGRRETGHRGLDLVRGRPCSVRFFLDGIHVPGFDIDLVAPEDIDGIEIYRGASEIPPIFRRYATCAVIAIWTREPGS